MTPQWVENFVSYFSKKCDVPKESLEREITKTFNAWAGKNYKTLEDIPPVWVSSMFQQGEEGADRIMRIIERAKNDS